MTASLRRSASRAAVAEACRLLVPVITLSCLLFLFAPSLLAADEAFNRGVKLYQEEKYAEAETAFKSATNVTSTVFYNIGNACYKQGKLGEAILYWEKGIRINPLDRDCAGNLELASRLLRDAVPPDETPLPLQWLAILIFALPLSYLEVSASWLWVLANVILILLILFDRPPPALKWTAIITFAICLLAWGLFAINKYHLTSSTSGVLLVPKESVRSGPGEQNTVLMEIHEGLKFKILNTQEDWVAVRMAGGYSGWLPARSIGTI